MCVRDKTRKVEDYFNSWIFSLKYYLLLFHAGKIYVVILFDEMKVCA